MNDTKPKILLIEDIQWERESAVRELRERFPGYEIVTAENFVTGANMALDSTVVAVITDNVMPRDADNLPKGVKPWATAICQNIQLRRATNPVPIAVFSNIMDIAAHEAERIALRSKGIHVSEDKSRESFERVMQFIETELAKKATTSTHLPANYKLPGTRTSGEVQL